MTLIRQHFRSERGGLTGWLIGVGLYSFYLTTLYQTVGKSMSVFEEYMQAMPPYIRAMIGGSFTLSSLGGWLQIELFSYLPFLLLIYASSAVSAIVSRELDRGTAEFLFGLPISRVRLLLARFAVFAVNVALIHGTLYLAAAAGAHYIDQAFPYEVGLKVVALSYLTVLAVSSLLLLLSVFIPDYSRAMFAGLGLATGLYFVTILLRAAGSGAAILPWTIFGRYDPSVIAKAGSHIGRDAVALIANTAVFLSAAVVAFARRDLKL
jgi:ABC-2 type transport system permease protein